VSENILNQTVEATQPPTLGYSPERSFVSVRDTPPNLGTSVDLSANHAADFAAILGPSVEATPTRNPTCVIAPIEHQTLWVPAEAHYPTLTHVRTYRSMPIKYDLPQKLLSAGIRPNI